MSTLEQFTAQTANELATLVARARAARRFVAHRACGDQASCRHCAAVRDAHLLIDDHLDQLETAALEDAFLRRGPKARA